jgi:hypothetical protein
MILPDLIPYNLTVASNRRENIESMSFISIAFSLVFADFDSFEISTG